jgi:hypothetical protein
MKECAPFAAMTRADPSGRDFKITQLAITLVVTTGALDNVTLQT